MPNMNDIQDYLGQLTGKRSVPRVFIGKTFFGGGDDTVSNVLRRADTLSLWRCRFFRQAAALKSGKLLQRLKEVNAL